MENRRQPSIHGWLIAFASILTFGIVCDVQAASTRQVAPWELTEEDIPKTATPAHQAALRRTFSKVVAERERGAKILGNIGRDATAVIPFLIRLLPDDELVPGDFCNFADVEFGRVATPSLAAERGLLWIGEPAVPLLVETLHSRNAPPLLRIRIASRLGHMGDCRAVSPLIEVTGAGDKHLGCVAVSALGELRDRAAVPCLLKIVQDPTQDSSLRKVAARSLGEIGDPSALSALTRIACDKYELSILRRMAIGALGELGDRASLPVLLKLLDSTEGEPRTAAVGAIACFSSQSAVDRLVAVLQTPGEPLNIKKWASSGLAISKDPAVVSRLLRYLGGNDPGNKELRYYATAYLAASDDQEALNFVFRGLGVKDVGIRQASVDAVLKIRSVRAVPMLTAVVRDPRWAEDELLQGNAFFAFSQIPTIESADALIEVARDPRLPLMSRLCALGSLGRLRLACTIPRLAQLASSHEVEIREQVAQVLGIIGSTRASEILRKALNDPNEMVRKAAKYSLVSIGEEP